MPAALAVDRQQVQMLALTYGVREAARMMGIPEATVQAWSAREGWLENAPRSQPLPPTVVRPATVATIDPANLLKQAMKEDAFRGRAAALKAGRKALEEIAEMPAKELATKAVSETAKNWGGMHATAAGYGAQDSVARVAINVTAGASKVETTGAIEGQELPPVDGQWSD